MVEENSPVFDLCLMALAGFEFHFTLQINIPCCEQPLIHIGINSPDRKLQFRMVGDDLIGRLPLFNEGRNDPVFFTKFMLGKIDSGSGIRELFTVFTV